MVADSRDIDPFPPDYRQQHFTFFRLNDTTIYNKMYHYPFL
jgi:hypothetical protein